MSLSQTTTNGAPTLSRTPTKDGGQFINDVSNFQATTKAGIRYADDFSNADYGAKVNAAIADLGSRGGIVVLRPNAKVSYSTTIAIGANPIQLVGDHIPTNESEATAPKDNGTHLEYTGTGNAIEVSADDGSSHVGFGFKGILLECSNASATGGIVFVGQAYSILFENITVDGPGKAVTTFTGIDIPKFAPATSSSHVGRWVKLRKCGIGLRLEQVNASTWSSLQCVFNAIGCQITGDNSSNGNTFVAPWFEQNTIGFDLLYAKQTTLLGGYNEDAAAGDRYIVAGGTSDGGRFCDSLTIINPYMTGGGVGFQPEHFIKLNRARNTTIIGGRAKNYTVSVINNVLTGTWAGQQVHNLSSEEDGSPTQQDLPIWDDTGGVTITTDQYKNITYPNMPTSDPSVLGELWSSSGFIKISAG